MTEPRDTASGFDLEAAFAALARDERAARPAPSSDLVARVLIDAAGMAAEATAGRRPAAVDLPRRRAANSPAASGGGWLRLFGFGDAWAGATVAAVVLVLAMSMLAGYEAGPGMLQMTGLEGSDTLLADAGGDLFGPEEGAL